MLKLCMLEVGGIICLVSGKVLYMKFLHFESSLIPYKVQLIWLKGTQDIVCLVHVGLFWTVCKEATIACVNWDILRK